MPYVWNDGFTLNDLQLSTPSPSLCSMTTYIHINTIYSGDEQPRLLFTSSHNFHVSWGNMNLRPEVSIPQLVMSGFEIAGLVLGAFPLAIEGIKSYSNGIQTIKDMKHYQQILCQFARHLGIEQCKYKNTFTNLLAGLANPADIERMKAADLRSGDWEDEDFQSQLKG